LKKIVSGILPTLLVFGMLTLTFTVAPVFSLEPYIGVYPPHTTPWPSDTFTVKINISSTVPFVGYQFYLYWNRTYINATDLTETPPAAWIPFYAGAGLKWNYNATHGRIQRAVLDTHHPFVNVTGTFTVATITFKVLKYPSPPKVVTLDLDYENTFLSDKNANKITPYYVYDGDVTVRALPVLSTVYFNLNPNPVGVGEILTLKGILIDEYSKPLPSEAIKIYARTLAGLWTYVTSLTTNGYGIFIWQVKIPSVPAGTYVFAAYYPGSITYKSCYNYAILIIQ